MRMRSLFRSIIFVSLLFAAIGVSAQTVGAGRADASSGGYVVTGKVFLPNGKPGAGAKIDINCDFTYAQGVTDAEGLYRITGIAGGPCTLSVKMTGYETHTENRTINSENAYGGGINIPIYLRSDPYSGPLFSGVPKTSLDKFKKAMEKLDKGDADGAMSLLDQAIASYANFAPALYEKGQIHVKRSENEKAIEALVKAIQIKPDYLEAKYAFGVAQFQKKDYEVSEAVFRDVLQKTDMPEAHLNLGISLFYLKKVEAAETELKAAAASKSGEKLALAHLYLGQIYIQRKSNPEAISELQKYLELVPKAPNADRVKTMIADLKKQS